MDQRTDEKPTMKLSLMSYTFTRQMDRFDLDAMLDLIEELQLDGIDIMLLDEPDPATVGQRCAERGVPVVALTFGLDLAHTTGENRRNAFDTFRRFLDQAHALGTPRLLLTTPAKPGLSSAQCRRRWLDALAEAVPMARQAGLTLTIENFPGKQSPFVTSAHVLEALQAVPDLRLTFDSGNTATGEDPGESFRRTAAYTVHAHFKDWQIRNTPGDGYREMVDGRGYRSALIGEGDVDNRGVLVAMWDCGYDGCINIEYEANDYDPFEATRRVAAYLRQCAAEIGWTAENA